MLMLPAGLTTADPPSKVCKEHSSDEQQAKAVESFKALFEAFDPLLSGA